MIFRLSEKLSTQVKVVSLAALPLDDNPYADWSARIFLVSRTKYLIVTNTKSLYSTVMYAKGINSENEFVGRALGGIREFMDDDGQQLVYDRFIAPASSSVRFGKTLSRTVTGSMNDLIFHATMWLTDGKSPHDVGFKLNDIPFSWLMAAGKPYGQPRKVFKEMLVQA